MKSRKIPATINTDPIAFANVTFSRKKMIPVNVEKRGVVEDIGTARASEVFMKLYDRKNYPKPSAIMPPLINAATDFLCVLKKLSFLSIMRDKISKAEATETILMVLTANAWSRVFVSGRVTATSIIVMLTDHIKAVARAKITPLTKTFFCISAAFASLLLKSQIPETIMAAPRIVDQVTCSPIRNIAHKRLNNG
jgi:hypothetical protein